MENIMQITELAFLALGCFIVALLIKTNRTYILQYAATLINAAEQAIQGSGMGAEKKKLVIAQLEAAGIRVTAWLSAMIDEIVACLNASGAWLATQARQHAADLQERTDEAAE